MKHSIHSQLVPLFLDLQRGTASQQKGVAQHLHTTQQGNREEEEGAQDKSFPSKTRPSFN